MTPRSTRTKPNNKHWRLNLVSTIITIAFVIISTRLFYWQIIKKDLLRTQADTQYNKIINQLPSRGKIYTSDGYLLVGNQPAYQVYIDPQLINQDAQQLSDQILPIIIEDYQDYHQATQEAVKKELKSQIEQTLKEKLGQKNGRWVTIKNKISQQTKENLEQLQIDGLGFDQYEVRNYPEGSMAAHVTGFVGKNKQGEDTGYFGIEGSLNKELKGYNNKIIQTTNALGLKIFNQRSPDGRDITLTIRRDIQAILEENLKQGIKQYGAVSGEAIIMEPKTGKILGLAAFPSYAQQSFFQYSPELYKNPTLTNLYEPGSTFKVITVAAGLDTQTIKPDTKCDKCDEPRTFGQYTIRTWNDQYNPDITMTDALAKSDNIAMIFIEEKLGADKFYEYVKKFGIGEKTFLDLQEDTVTPLDTDPNEVNLATKSFGQGITTSSMQMTRAFATVANGGIMMRPMILEKVTDPNTNEEIFTQPKMERQVLDRQTATDLTKMMVAAAEHGEAQWISSKTYSVAGKTGTSQIPGEGGYLEDKTIASFIGFAPATDPQFVMLIKLTEPSVSPWAAETAAPLWYKIANKLFLLLNIPPDYII